VRNEGVERALRRGVAFLQATQLADGSFDSFSSPTRSPFRPATTYHTTFTPALVLRALGRIDLPAAVPIREALARWLLAQKSPGWSFNYWAKDAPERQDFSYPDDLDDTFCALLALHIHNPALIDEECLGQVVKLLVAAESQVGGPYRTWLTRKNAAAVWRDIDLAVNANIACFLAGVAQPLPNLTQFMKQAIDKQDFRSPYYPSSYPLAYYLARAYNGPEARQLVRYLMKRRVNGAWGNALHTALAISTLQQVEPAIDTARAINSLLAQQQTNGSWPAVAFCFDPNRKGQPHYSGAASLTTAFALEALARHLSKTPQSSTPQARRAATTSPRYARIITIARQELRNLKEPLRTQGLTALQRMESGRSNTEIVLLPELFHASLLPSLQTANARLLTELGLANVYGWTAYTLYDDMLDGHSPPGHLPAANVALRYSLWHFEQALPAHNIFRLLVRRTFNRIDSANAWEVAHCRSLMNGDVLVLKSLPQYPSSLYVSERSLGHALTPLGVLAAAGLNPQDPPARSIERALQHYLAARQLADDLHDWEEDLHAGHLTFVVTTLLREIPIPLGQSLPAILPRLQRQFWYHTLPHICQIITKHTRLARQAANKSELLKPRHLIASLVDTIDATTAHTLKEQSKAQKFLNAYRR
jgi:hypothetical protein